MHAPPSFWHIPWPNPEPSASARGSANCWTGLLGGRPHRFPSPIALQTIFWTPWIACWKRGVDRERFAVKRAGHLTSVRPFPISVTFADDAAEQADADAQYAERAALLGSHGLRASMLGIGVDRVDYTKGLPERFLALERFLEKISLVFAAASPSCKSVRQPHAHQRYQDLLDTGARRSRTH